MRWDMYVDSCDYEPGVQDPHDIYRIVDGRHLAVRPDQDE